jgi:hypothetical protein
MTSRRSTTDNGHRHWLMKPVMLALALLFTSIGSANAQTDGSHALIGEISSDGYLILMADNTVWLVEGYYVSNTTVWSATDNITFSSGNDRCMNVRSMLLVNVDEHDIACAERVH